MTDSRKLNIAAAVAHSLVLVFEVIILVMLYEEKNSFDTTSYVTSKHRNEFKLEVLSSRPLIPGWKQLLPVLLCSFTGVTAVAHVLYATKLRTAYQAAIVAENNWFRWLEYAISATIMLVIIALSSGVSDTNALFVMSIVSVCVMLLGQIAEKHMAGSSPDLATAKLSTLVAWLLFLSAWSFVFVQYAEQVYQINALAPVKNTDPDKPSQTITIPSFVTALVITMFLVYSSFGIVQLVQLYLRSRHKKVDFAKIDRSYIILSFVAKTLLPIVFTVGLVQRSQISDEASNVKI